MRFRDLEVKLPPTIEMRDDGELIWLSDLGVDEFRIEPGVDGAERCYLAAGDFTLDFRFGVLRWAEVATPFETEHGHPSA